MKIRFDKIKEFFEKLPRVMAEHAFLAFLGLIFFALVFGGILFYQYSILAEKTEPEITKEIIQFKENLYQKILEIWQERTETFEKADLKTYPDPFR